MSKVTQEFTIEVLQPPPPPLQIATKSLPPATIGEPYSAQILLSGGVPPDQLSVISGQLPDGLTLSPDGSISGTPADDAVAETFVIGAQDSSPDPQSPGAAAAFRIPVAK